MIFHLNTLPDRFGDRIELYEFILGAILGAIVTYSWHNYWYPIIGLIYIFGWHLHHFIAGLVVVLIVWWNPRFLHKLPSWLDGVVLGFGIIVMLDDARDIPLILTFK